MFIVRNGRVAWSITYPGKGEISDASFSEEDDRHAIVEAEQMADVEIRSVYLGVTGGHVRGFNNRGVHPVVSADREIARLGARIARVVLGDVELARVDEDRHDRRRIIGVRLAHERAVTVVEPAHGRHQANYP
jgi:cell division ATPase FtsA